MDAVPGDLRPILEHVPGFVLVLARLSGLFILAPIFGSRNVFRMVKVMLVLSLTACVYPALVVPGPPSGGTDGLVGSLVGQELSLWWLAPMFAMELLIGFTVGYLVILPLTGMQVGGIVLSYQMGMNFAQATNPEFDDQSGMIEQVMFMLGLTIFVALGGHAVMLQVLIGSFQYVPMGGYVGIEGVVDSILGILQTVFEMGLRVGAPMVCLLFMQTVSLGFIAKTVPQLNIMTIGFILRILVGGSLMGLLVGLAARLYVGSTQEVFDELSKLFGGG